MTDPIYLTKVQNYKLVQIKTMVFQWWNSSLLKGEKGVRENEKNW